MTNGLFKETRQLEDAFFSKRDAELIAKLRRQEQQQNQKKALTEVSGIADEAVLDQLVAHDIHPEALAAFSLVPILEIAWADGQVQSAERRILLEAVEKAGKPKGSVSYRLMEGWLARPPDPKLMDLWKNYTRALVREVPGEIGRRIKETVLQHARAVAEAAGGFLGFGRISEKEARVLEELESAFEIGEIGVGPQ